MALTKGTPDQRAQAAQLLEGIDPARLSRPEDRTRLDKARQALQTPAAPPR